MVAREPSPEVYRAVREARKTLIISEMIRKGKGLMVSRECKPPGAGKPHVACVG